MSTHIQVIESQKELCEACNTNKKRLFQIAGHLLCSECIKDIKDFDTTGIWNDSIIIDDVKRY